MKPNDHEVTFMILVATIGLIALILIFSPSLS